MALNHFLAERYKYLKDRKSNIIKHDQKNINFDRLMVNSKLLEQEVYEVNRKFKRHDTIE